MKIKKLTSVFLGSLLLCSLTSGFHLSVQARSQKTNGSKLKTWRKIPKDWPERVKKSPYLKNDRKYGIFVCLAESNPLWVKQHQTDPLIPSSVKAKYSCPRGTVLIRTVKPLRFPPGMNNFACVVAPNPEDLVPNRNPAPPTDAKTELPVNDSSEKPICPYLTVGVDIMVDIDYDAINQIKGAPPSAP
jgi:hypothetical protein